MHAFSHIFFHLWWIFCNLSNLKGTICTAKFCIKNIGHHAPSLAKYHYTFLPCPRFLKWLCLSLNPLLLCSSFYFILEITGIFLLYYSLPCISRVFEQISGTVQGNQETKSRITDIKISFNGIKWHVSDSILFPLTSH